MIVLEGADGVGKTTLADALGGPVIKCGPPPMAESLFKFYLKMIDEAPDDAVFDRLHLGEMVYGPALRGGSRLTLTEVALLDARLNARGAVRVLCDIDAEIAVARLMARDGGAPDALSGVKVEQTHLIVQSFHAVATLLRGWNMVNMNQYPAAILWQVRMLKPHACQPGVRYKSENPLLNFIVETDEDALAIAERMNPACMDISVGECEVRDPLSVVLSNDPSFMASTKCARVPWSPRESLDK